MQGINAISPTGRALEAATANMTPEQQAQYIQQQQQSGVPLNPQLALMMIQLNKLKQAQTQQPAGPPPTTTVAQDLDKQLGGVASLPVSNVGNEKSYAGGGIVAFAGAGSTGGEFGGPYSDEQYRAAWEARQAELAAQEAARAARMGAGIGAPAAAAAVESPLVEKGLWSLAKRNKGKLGLGALAAYGGYKYLTSDGDKVSDKNLSDLITGGATAPPSGPDSNVLAKYLQDMKPSGSGGGAGAVGVPMGGFNRIFAEQRDEEAKAQKEADIPLADRVAEEQKVGEQFGMGQADKARSAELAVRKAELKNSSKKDFWTSLAVGFFKGAGKASEGENTIGSLATSFGSATELMQVAANRREELDKELSDQQYLADKGSDMVKAGYVKEGRATQDKAQSRAESLRDKGRDLETSIETLKAHAAIEQQIAQIQASRSTSKQDEDLKNKIIDMVRKGAPMEDVQAMIDLKNSLTPSYAVAGLRADSSAMIALRNSDVYKRAQFLADPSNTTSTPEQKAYAANQIRLMEAQVTGDAPTSAATPAGPYGNTSGFRVVGVR